MCEDYYRGIYDVCESISSNPWSMEFEDNHTFHEFDLGGKSMRWSDRQ